MTAALALGTGEGGARPRLGQGRRGRRPQAPARAGPSRFRGQQQIIAEVGEPVDLAIEDSEHARGPLGCRLRSSLAHSLHRLHLKLQRGQRRPHLVRGEGEEKLSERWSGCRPRAPWRSEWDWSRFACCSIMTGLACRVLVRYAVEHHACRAGEGVHEAAPRAKPRFLRPSPGRRPLGGATFACAGAQGGVHYLMVPENPLLPRRSACAGPP